MPAIGVFIDEECEDPATLKEEAIAYLQCVKEPSVTYEADVIDLAAFGREWEEIALGDTVYGCKLAIAEDGSVTALIDRAAGVFDGSENITWQITADGSTRQNVYCNAHDKFRDIITTGGLAQFEINIFKAITNRADRGQYTAYLDNGYLNMQFPSGMFSSVAELKSWLSANNVQFTYPLDTPITIQLDPVTISTISGQTNNLWSDAGVVTVEFAADLKHYIDSKIAAAVAALS